MSKLRSSRRLAVLALACLAVGGCSFFRHDAKPAAPVAPSAAPASAVAPRAALAPASPTSAPATWDPPPRHLDATAMVGQAWTFPSANPQIYRDVRFVFRGGGRVEASDAREHVTGTWTLERDKLCVTLNASASGTACYVVTGSKPDDLQIRALPDGERLPLKIQ